MTIYHNGDRLGHNGTAKRSGYKLKPSDNKTYLITEKHLEYKRYTIMAESVNHSPLQTHSLRWNETRYQKSERRDLERFLPRSAKQVRWALVHYPQSSTCEFGPTQIDFFDKTISALRVCWLLKFLHALEFDQALVAHIATGVGGPLKNFKGQHLKLGLKFHTWASITLGLVGLPSRNFTRGRGSRPGWSSGH